MITANTVLINKLNRIMEISKFVKNATANVKKRLKRTSNEEKTIILGIGGFTASGKTMLIESIYTLLDKKPDFFKDNEIKANIIDKERVYKSPRTLVEYIQKTGGIRNQTQNEVEVSINRNMYEFSFSLPNNNIRIVLRDIPGEMYNQYFAQNTTSLNAHFNEFINNKRVNIDLKSFRQIFVEGCYEDTKKVNQTIQNIQNPQVQNVAEEYINTPIQDNTKLITDLRDKFFSYVKSQDTNYLNNSDIEDNFAAFLFVKIADFDLYCLSLDEFVKEDNELTDVERKIKGSVQDSFTGFISYNSKNSLLCFTQFDKHLQDNKIKENMDKEEQKKDDYFAYMNKIYLSIGNQTDGIFVRNYVDAVADKINNLAIPFFLTSTAYIKNSTPNFAFRRYPNDEKEALTHCSDHWNKYNIKHRSSMGIFEMLLYIFKKSGCEDFGLPIPTEEEMRIKIGDDRAE